MLDQSWDDSDLDCNKELANENETDDVPTIQKLEELEVDNLVWRQPSSVKVCFYIHFMYFIKCIIAP